MDNFELQNYQLIMQLRAKVDEVRKLASTTDTGLYDAIDQLETDIGRGLLKLYAVIELLIEKGVITSGDLAAKSAELDDMDGNVDGKLHPAYFRTTEENERQLTTQAYLRKLQSKVFESPQQFLARLEREASDPAN